MLKKFFTQVYKKTFVPPMVQRFSENKERPSNPSESEEKIDQTQEKANEYDDYGDFKIKRDGRKIQVDEEDGPTGKKSLILS